MYSLFLLVRSSGTLVLNCKTGSFEELGALDDRTQLLANIEVEGLELPMPFKVVMSKGGEMLSVECLPMALLNAAVPPEVPTSFD